jgi:hypothetical protein
MENEENHSDCKSVARWRHAGPGAAQEDTSDGFDLGGRISQCRDAKGGAAVLSLVGTLDKSYELLLGRKTYDIFAGHWPKVLADDPIGSVFTRAPQAGVFGLVDNSNPSAAKLFDHPVVGDVLADHCLRSGVVRTVQLLQTSGEPP